MDFLLMMVLIFGVFYFIVIRPQSKARKEREQMLRELKKGDEIVTNGGVFGTVSGIKDGVVTLLISDRVRIRVLLTQIAGLAKQFTKSEDEDEDESEEDED